MHKQFYFLSPVEVVKVSSQNLEEVAKWCGGEVAKVESRRVAGRMDPYVWVPTPKGSSISWAFPGMFITKRLVVTVKGELRATWSVFRRDYFEKNYFETPEEAVNKTWELENKPKKPTPKDMAAKAIIKDGAYEPPKLEGKTIVININGASVDEVITELKRTLEGEEELQTDG